MGSSEKEAHKKKPVLYVPVGMSGCGKTTYGEKLDDAVIVSSDLMRQEYFGDASIQFDERYGKDIGECNAFIFSKVDERTSELLKAGRNVYYDATNLNPVFRKKLIQDFKADAYMTAILFQVSPDTARDRNKQRNRVVPEKTLNHQEWMMSHITPHSLKEEGFQKVIVIR